MRLSRCVPSFIKVLLSNRGKHKRTKFYLDYPLPISDDERWYVARMDNGRHWPSARLSILSHICRHRHFCRYRRSWAWSEGTAATGVGWTDVSPFRGKNTRGCTCLRNSRHLHRRSHRIGRRRAERPTASSRPIIRVVETPRSPLVKKPPFALQRKHAALLGKRAAKSMQRTIARIYRHALRR